MGVSLGPEIPEIDILIHISLILVYSNSMINSSGIYNSTIFCWLFCVFSVSFCRLQESLDPGLIPPSVLIAGVPVVMPISHARGDISNWPTMWVTTVLRSLPWFLLWDVEILEIKFGILIVEQANKPMAVRQRWRLEKDGCHAELWETNKL